MSMDPERVRAAMERIRARWPHPCGGCSAPAGEPCEDGCPNETTRGSRALAVLEAYASIAEPCVRCGCLFTCKCGEERVDEGRAP